MGGVGRRWFGTLSSYPRKGDVADEGGHQDTEANRTRSCRGGPHDRVKHGVRPVWRTPAETFPLKSVPFRESRRLYTGDGMLRSADPAGLRSVRRAASWQFHPRTTESARDRHRRRRWLARARLASAAVGGRLCVPGLCLASAGGSVGRCCSLRPAASGRGGCL